MTTPEETREQRLARLRAMIGKKVGQTAPVTQGPVPDAVVSKFESADQLRAQQFDDFGEVTVDPALYADSRAKPVIHPGETPVTTGPTPGSRPIEIASIPEDQLPLLSDDEYFSRRMRK